MPRVDLANERNDVVSNADAEKFIGWIRRERKDGFGFVPLIGAGFSAPSGVPLIRDLEKYLNRCICLALGAASASGQTKNVSQVRPWIPRTDRWPPLSKIIEWSWDPNEVLTIFDGRVKRALSECGFTEADRARRRELEAKLRVIREAIGATADWRSALQFLSRLEVTVVSGTGGRRIQVPQTPHAEVIDACFREVLRGKQPTLGHRMIAILAGAMRLDLILTTNFDDLLERAFEASRNPLTVFEVPQDGALPQWSAVNDVRSLIKLHGNRTSLRADYTLDELASPTDRSRFVEYLTTAEGRAELTDASPYGSSRNARLPCSNHLLVLGHSVSERRIRDLIMQAWEQLDPEFRVYWLCHSNSDVELVREFTANAHARLQAQLPADWKGSRVLHYPDFGLFLLQLFQHVRRNLPAHAGLFPSVARLPHPLLPSPEARTLTFESNQALRAFHDALTDRLLRKKDGRGFALVTSEPSVHGASTACSEFITIIEKEKKANCLWLDLSDISNADNLFESVLEAMHYRLGTEAWLPCYLATDRDRPRGNEVRRLLKCVEKPWVLVLNARDTPGANTASLDGWNDAPPHGWFDDTEKGSSTANAAAVVRFIDELTNDKCDLRILLLCRHVARESVLGSNLALVFGDDLARLDFPATASSGFDIEHVVPDSIRWAASCEIRARFFMALLLMQRPRALATIWSKAVRGSDQPADASALEWLTELESIGLIRRKPGGFVWIHSIFRQRIRYILRHRGELRHYLSSGANFPEEWEVHCALTGWYQRILDSSREPAAVFEIAYHCCRAAETRLLADTSKDGAAWAERRIQAAYTLLRTHRFLIQTRGYSRASCRRLEYLRGQLRTDIITAMGDDSRFPSLSNELDKLRRVCTEVMRAVAREVGEDGTAYRRHREIAEIMAGVPEPGLRTRGPLSVLAPAWLQGKVKQLDWLRWWRWSGMLATASRSYPAALSALSAALRYAMLDVREMLDANRHIDWKRIENADFGKAKISGMPDTSPDETQALQLWIEVLRAAEQYINLELQQDAIEHRLRRLPTKCDSPLPDDTTSRRKLDDIETHIAAAQALVSRVRDTDSSSGGSETVTAVWCQSRLLTHLSTCKIRRLQFDRARAIPQTAMGLLGDAEASLRIADPQRLRSDLALIDLHRAEVRLLRAEVTELSVGQDEEKLSLAAWCRKLEVLNEDSQQRARLFAKLSDVPTTDVRKVRALVNDALRFLDRAEPVLRERRRNVWWTCWYFERKLRAIALSVWLSIFEPRAPIPFLGFEATPPDIETEAEELLALSWRMIRVDSYRLGTAIESFTSICNALRVRLLMHPDTDLATRAAQKDRYRNLALALHAALTKLDSVHLQRQTPTFARDNSAKDQVDERIQQYISRLSEYARSVPLDI